MNTPQFFIDYYGPADSTRIYFRAETDDGRVFEAQPVGMMLFRPDASVRDPIRPMIQFDGKEGTAALQSLMDELWKTGVRPKDIGTPGHLAATQSHLNDMRALVQKTLDVKLP